MSPVRVTPLAGVWIEMPPVILLIQVFQVTPLAGVWIEILKPEKQGNKVSSLPLRECGLKLS